MDEAKEVLEIKAEEKEPFLKPQTLRRFVAFLLDFMLLIVLTSCLYAFVVQPIANRSSTYKEKYNEFKVVLVESGLYEYKENGDYQKITSNSSYGFYDIDAKLLTFYESYEKVDVYNGYKKAQAEVEDENYRLFYLSGETYLPVEEKIDSKEMKSWLSNVVDASISNILEKTEKWQNAASAASRLIVQYITLSMVICATVIYLLFPLIFKGPTIGKKLMGLKIYNYKKENYVPSHIQILLRFFFFVLIELILGIMTYGFIPLISFVVSCATKKGQSLHDYIARTAVTTFEEKKTNPVDSFSEKARAMQID